MEKTLNINKKRLGIIGGAGGVGLIAVILSLFLSGTVFAAFPIAGVGGFVVAADKIEGKDFKLYPELGPTEEKAVWGNAAVDLAGETKIKGLVLSKNIDLRGALDAYGVNTIDVVVTSAGGDVVGQDLKLRVTGIQADNADFGGLVVEEENTDNPLNVLSLEAPTLDLLNAELNTHFLKADQISIPGLKVKIIHNNSDGTKVGDF